MNERRLFFPILLAISLGALVLRVVPLYDRVILPDSVRFQSVDPYYHVRLSRHLTEHFPRRLEYDSLRLHPSGQRVDVYPAYDLVNAMLALATGAGAPSSRTTDLAIAWSPPLLGAGTVLLLGLAGRVIAGPWGGLAAAFVAGFLPGGTLSQSVIGLSDHHALESFLLAWAWWMLARLLRRDEPRRRWSAVGLGLATGAYALTWEGGPVLPAVIAMCVFAATVRYAADVEKLRTWAVDVGIVSLVAVGVCIAAAFWSPMITVSATILLAASLLAPLMVLVHRLLPTASVARRRGLWTALLVAAAALLAAALPADLARSLATNLSRFDPSAQARTVNELRPLIDDLQLTWDHYGAALAWAVVGIGLSATRILRKQADEALVPLVTGLIFVPAALMQTRFAASASLPLALLSGVVVGALVASSSAARTDRVQVWSRRGALLLWCASVAIWSAWQAPSVASVDRGPTPDWSSVAEWFRTHTPEVDTLSVAGSSTVVRRPGVLNWWDSGYYLTTLAGRVPVSNPSQAGARAAADAYLDTSGARGIDGLRQEGIRYVIVDAGLSLAMPSSTQLGGQFPALTIWAGKDLGRYFREVYFERDGGVLEPRYAFLPEYYRTLLIRLLIADGEAVSPAPGAAWALQLERRRAVSGRQLDVVRSSRSFPTPEALSAFLQHEADSTWVIAGFSPVSPCVPLERMENIELAFASPTPALSLPSSTIPRLKVYRMLTP